jgi:hypothetical protein
MESRLLIGESTLFTRPKSPDHYTSQLGGTWIAAGSPTLGKDGDTTIAESMTVNAAGPMAPGQDVMAVIYPRGKKEAAPQCESLADGAARITTRSSTDYVFASLDGMTFKNADVSFDGVAGAVRVFQDEVHLIVTEGSGTIRYKECMLRAHVPATRVVSMAAVAQGETLEVAAPKATITFALEEKVGRIEQVAPGVRRQSRGNGVAYAFDTIQPITFAQDQVVFSGKRGGILVDHQASTVRLVMLDGQKIGYGKLRAEVGSAPYDLTFHKDRLDGHSEGPGRFLHVTMPEGIDQLPALTIGGISYAPGTYGNVAIVPLLDGGCDFTLEDLKQPPVFRSWQRW